MSASDLYDSIRQEKAIDNATIYEPIKLKDVKYNSEAGDLDFDYSITFSNCYIYLLDAVSLIINKPVTFRRCVFAKADFYSTYVIAGLFIDRCVFKQDMYLLAEGGHNDLERSVIIKDSTFYGFVDVHDAWFGGQVEIRGCTFKKGSNLFGNKGQWCKVNFELNTPIVEDNIGELDLDGEL